MNLKQCIEQLMRKQDLTAEQCEGIVSEIIKEDANLLQVAALLVLLRAKPETPTEILGIVRGLKQAMKKISVPFKVLDIVGTGGDGSNTINISTGAAILAASCGIKVAKHGNRAVSSLCGAADVLEEVGIDLDISPEKVSETIAEIGIGFCFAPNFNPALLQLRSIRKQLNVPTTFNLIGPLLNPAQASHYLLGVYDEKLLNIYAEVLFQLGTDRSLIVHGHGLDELSCVGPAEAIEITRTGKRRITIDPQQLGLARCTVQDLKGGTPTVNAHLLKETFSGKPGPIADTLALNCAAALWIYGLYPSIAEALPVAQENLRNGAALKLLEQWVSLSRK